MQAIVYPQYKKGVPVKKPRRINGDISGDWRKLQIIRHYQVVAVLVDARIEVIGADGLRISGKEEDGNGKFYHQEWWISTIMAI